MRFQTLAALGLAAATLSAVPVAPARDAWAMSISSAVVALLTTQSV